MKVLVINAGSSSLKYQLINMDDESVIAKGAVERIGIEGTHFTQKVGDRVIDYVKDMPSTQKDIYYITAEREADARKSPVLESARQHGCDVLLWCDPVDEYLTESLRDFDGKKFVDVSKAARTSRRPRRTRTRRHRRS